MTANSVGITARQPAVVKGQLSGPMRVQCIAVIAAAEKDAKNVEHDSIGIGWRAAAAEAAAAAAAAKSKSKFVRLLNRFSEKI